MSVIDEVLAANKIYSRTHELRNVGPVASVSLPLSLDKILSGSENQQLAKFP